MNYNEYWAMHEFGRSYSGLERLEREYVDRVVATSLSANKYRLWHWAINRVCAHWPRRRIDIVVFECIHWFLRRVE